MCGHHWRMVPDTMKRAIWQAYQPGQERDQAPISLAYLEAAKKAIDTVTAQEFPLLALT